MSKPDTGSSRGGEQAIQLAGSSLGNYRHGCAFFNSPKEEYEILLPFVRAGIDHGERAYHVVPAKYREEHLDRLRKAGIDVEKAQQTCQLEVALPEDTYLRDGRFSKDTMLIIIQEALKAGQAFGFPRTRLIAHAETVLQHWSSVNDWVEYETRLNYVLPRYDDPVICTYDAKLLNGSIAFDILRTHPLAIIGGVLHENPFYARPQELLTQILGRESALPQPYRA
jgi:DcmR-like sensory protein